MADINFEKHKNPIYQILDENGFFGPDCKLWREGEYVMFTDEPNLLMKPMNEAARAEMKKFISKLEGFARQKALKDGREFTGLPVDMIRQLDDSVDSAIDENKRIMGLEITSKPPVRAKLKNSDPRIAAVVEKDPTKETEVMTLNLSVNGRQSA